MTSIGKKLRLGRIFQRDGRTLIVAMDHARFTGPIPGLEDPKKTIKSVIEGGADAIMTNFGVIKQFHDLVVGQLATILRIDSGATIYSPEDFVRSTKCGLIYNVEEAVKLGVDGVIVYALLGASYEFEIIKNLGKVVEKCEKWGMPLLVEALPVYGEKIDDPYNASYVSTAARIAQEYGADFIKTNYTGSSESFKEVTETCPVPVLIAGGEEMENPKDVLETVKGAINAGGKGVCFGRNIWMYEDPATMTRAISKVIHEGASVEEALEEL